MRYSRETGKRKGRRAAAFTLAEALLASTILAIVGATTTLPFVAGVQRTNEAARLEQAVALGEAMMEEVLARPFFEVGERTASPGPGAGETTRDKYNNLDDFHGFTESGTGLRDYRNVSITDASCSGLWRDVTVQYVTLPNQAASDTNSFVSIRVRVFDGNAPIVTLNRVASRED
jgi:MSHA pilin protein MshD